MARKPVFKFALTEEVEQACKDLRVNKESFVGDYIPTPHDFLPTRADADATGWDVRCATPGGIDLKPQCYIKIPLGFRTLSPKGWWLKLVPRSSTFIKRHINSLYGTIDETYEGQMFFCGQYIPDSCTIISGHNFGKVEFGDRIGQIIPVKRQEMAIEGISNKEFERLASERSASRGAGGFGSSGVK